jgi:hypothetical protein
MDRAELARRLRSRRIKLTEELERHIHHIEELEATLQVIEGREVTTPQTRTPGAEKPALQRELDQRCRDVRRIIVSLDREIEQIEAQRVTDGNLDLYPRGRQVINERDNLRSELQFYIDLIEALNYTPTRVTPEERAEANHRARTWAENLVRGRGNRRWIMGNLPSLWDEHRAESSSHKPKNYDSVTIKLSCADFGTFNV